MSYLSAPARMAAAPPAERTAPSLMSTVSIPIVMIQPVNAVIAPVPTVPENDQHLIFYPCAAAAIHRIPGIAGADDNHPYPEPAHNRPLDVRLGKRHTGRDR